jgi:hypothetical protein
MLLMQQLQLVRPQEERQVSHHPLFVFACIGQDLPFQLSTVYLCTTWQLDPKALALLPGLCIAVSLSLLCKNMVVSRPSLIVAMNAQT